MLTVPDEYFHSDSEILILVDVIYGRCNTIQLYIFFSQGWKTAYKRISTTHLKSLLICEKNMG